MAKGCSPGAGLAIFESVVVAVHLSFGEGSARPEILHDALNLRNPINRNGACLAVGVTRWPKSVIQGVASVPLVGSATSDGRNALGNRSARAD